MKTVTFDHYVSRGYLAGFTVDGRKRGRLFEADLMDRLVTATKPRYVARRLGFDRIDVPGLSPDAFEKALSGFESRTIQGIRSICQSRTMEDETLSRALAYVALLQVRNPRRARSADAGSDGGHQDHPRRDQCDQGGVRKRRAPSTGQRRRAAGPAG